MTNQLSQAQIDAMIDQALGFHRQGKLDAAAALYRDVIAVAPNDADAHHLLGRVAFSRNNFDEASRSFARAIAIAPNDERYYLSLSNVQRAQGRVHDAIESAGRAVALNSNFVEAWFNRGLLCAQAHRFAEALESLDRALKLNSQIPDVWFNRAAVLKELGNIGDALISLDRAIALDPNNPEVYCNRGAILGQVQRYADAIADFDAAIARKPNYADAYYNRGNALYGLKKYAQALRSFDAAIALSPRADAYHYNRGVVLAALRQFDQAISSYKSAIALNPNHAQAYNNCGVALNELGRFPEAVLAYDAALSLQKSYGEAHNNRGHALCALKKFSEAVVSYEAALAIDSTIPGLLGTIINTRMVLADWAGIDGKVQQLFSALKLGKSVGSPFGLLALPATATQLKQAAGLHAKAESLGEVSVANHFAKKQRTRIKVGYFSPDFRSHAVTYLTAGLFTSHDRTRFEVFGFSYGRADPADAMTSRLKRGFDHFIDVTAHSDDEIVARAHELDLDVAVDLAGYTLNARPGIFAKRVAPIQVNYLGFPGTMGVDFIDYIIADKTVLPPDQYPYFSEKAVIMSGTFQVNDVYQPLATAPPRSQVGLPENAVVYCCFNAAYKLNKEMFTRWLAILLHVPGSVLWLVPESPEQVQNLKTFAREFGLSPDRLIFAERLAYEQHLARYQLADLALDTLPFNGGATTSDALRAGVPVLTAMGETFAGRMAASLLRAVELPELITTSLDDYQAFAIRLGQQPHELKAIRAKLQASRATCPLFDTPGFTRHLEAAFTRMVAWHDAGQEPQTIVF